MTLKFRLLLFLASILLPAALRAQQQEVSNIVGQLRVARGDFPSHQIMIRLMFRGSPMASTYADTEGKFGFDGLGSGEYHIVINDPDYNPVDERVIIHSDITANTLAFLILRPRQKVQRADVIGSRASGSNPFLVDPEDYNKHFPKKALKEYERGLEAERKGKGDDAMLHYRDALKIAPDYYPAHNNLGSLYLSKSDFASAEAQFQDAVRLDQNDPQAYFNLANVFLLKGQYNESETAVTTGLQRRPDSAFGRFLQGCLYGRAGNFPEAEKSLRAALRLDATMWQAHLQLVSVYLHQQRRQDAIAELQVFLNAFPLVSAAEKAKELLQKLQAENNPPHPSQ